jgi:metallophosphoesterase superfamily enzyme
MIDPVEKSTEVTREPKDPENAFAFEEVSENVVLDSRLGIFHREAGWLVASDLHFGYEVSRRAAGGLWPLWGMETIVQRLHEMVETWNPDRLILVGDVVDSAAAPREAIAWLGTLHELVPELILIEGNHDRGEVRRAFDFLPSYQSGQFFFHHGHLDRCPRDTEKWIEVTGHFHPSVRFADGAGTSLGLPALTRERFAEGGELWRLPAFSPWAAGHPNRPTEQTSEFQEWACGGGRIIKVQK